MPELEYGERVSEKLTNGNTINYKEYHGIYFNEKTPDEVVRVLTRAYEEKFRIRVYYGETETGKDWQEVYQIRGTVGRSTGRIKIPLLIHSVRSHGGPALLDRCIIRIDSSPKGVTYYQHPNYHIEKD